jgi:16S rRNA (cytosine1402-N4)-methyltransferase
VNGAGQAHVPVLLDEAVDALQVQGDRLYVDGTFGRGGHSARILERLGAQGRLLCFDKDADAVAYGRERFGADPRFLIEHASFVEVGAVVGRLGWAGRVQGLLLDLGVSSPQLDEAERGFSFQHDGALDMRMDRGSGRSAAQWLAEAEEAEIADVIYQYGEERFARRIARQIVAERRARPIERTAELAELVARACPTRERHKHPATRTFQAIRIFVNRELDDLQDCLRQSLDLLAAGARLVVISFHSLEDRIVKRFMRDAAQGPKLPKGLPVTHEASRGRLRLVGRAVHAGEDELRRNPRARSAVMRVAEVLA